MESENGKWIEAAQILTIWLKSFVTINLDEFYGSNWDY